MSHTTQLELRMRNHDAIMRAIARIPGAKFLGIQTVQFFSDVVNGIAVELPGFRYPIVVHPITGVLSMDVFNWRWGDESTLNTFSQAYGVEVAKLTAEENGYGFEEVELENGDIRCRLTIDGSVDYGGGLETNGFEFGLG